MSERPAPEYIADTIVDEILGAGPADMSDVIARAIRAERADADRRAAEERAAILRWLREADLADYDDFEEIADGIERGEYLRGTP